MKVGSLMLLYVHENADQIRRKRIKIIFNIYRSRMTEAGVINWHMNLMQR